MPRRIWVRGTSGSGKSTLASNLSKVLGIPHVEIDNLHHLPGWIQRPHVEFHRMLREQTSGDEWVVDGNYQARVESLIAHRMDTLVWLDYPLHVVMHRLLKRTYRRAIKGEPCCNGNYESLRRSMSRESILLWALTTHTRRKRQCREVMKRPDFEHVQRVWLQNPRQADEWLATLRSNMPE